MSEEQNSEAASEVAESNQEMMRAGRVDWFLAQLIWLADNVGLEQSVTLSVRGTIITGLLISGREYFKDLGDDIRKRANVHLEDKDAIRNLLADLYSQGSQHYPVRPSPETEPDSEPKPFPTYIHLRASKMLGPNGFTIPIEGALWRGKLSAVDGFSIGQVS
jgi:hypothetical protein